MEGGKATDALRWYQCQSCSGQEVGPTQALPVWCPPHADLADLLVVPIVWAGATPSSEGQFMSWVIHHHCSYLA